VEARGRSEIAITLFRCLKGIADLISQAWILLMLKMLLEAVRRDTGSHQGSPNIIALRSSDTLNSLSPLWRLFHVD
jgi:hypothetical protein